MQWIYSQGGVFPVRRGARDEEAFITAETILDHGGVVAMYPEGGRSRTGQLAERARPGIGRLALDTGAPVVPVAIHGSAQDPQLEAAAASRACACCSASRCASSASRTPRGSASRRSPTRSSQRIRELYAQLGDRM